MSFLAANSASSFVVELSTYNHPHRRQANEDDDGCIPCRATFESSEALLPDTSGYSVAVLGWSISTGESLSFTEPDINPATNTPYQMVEYAHGISGEDGHIIAKSEVKSLNERTHNFSAMCDLLTSDSKDMQILQPTAGGGIIFRNEDYKNPNAFKSVKLSSRFCDRFRLHKAPVIRHRVPSTRKDSVLHQVADFLIDSVIRLDSTATTEALGVVMEETEDPGRSFSLLFEEPLWSDATDGSYVFQALEISFLDEDFLEEYAEDGRVLCEEVTITVDQGVWSAEITTAEDVGALAEGTRFQMEHPTVKGMFRVLHNVLCPEIPCEITPDEYQDGGSIRMSYQNFQRLKNGYATHELADKPIIVMQAPVQRLRGFREGGGSNGRRIHLSSPKYVFLDARRNQVDESNAFQVRITWENAYIGGAKLDEDSTVGDSASFATNATIRLAATNPGEDELYKPFELAYLINRGRDGEEKEPYIDSDPTDFQWETIDQNFERIPERKRFDACHESLTTFLDFFSSTGMGHNEPARLTSLGNQLIKGFSETPLYGIGEVPQFSKADRIVLITESQIRLLQGSDFQKTITCLRETSIQFFQPEDFLQGILFADTEDPVEARRQILFQCTLDTQQVASVKSAAGHTAIVKFDGDEIDAQFCGMLDGQAVFSASEKDVRAYDAFRQNFAVEGDTRDVSIQFGTRDDIYHDMRIQGLTDPDSFVVEADRTIRLYPGDYIKSFSSADDQMMYSRIAITSQDLLVQPVLSSGFRSLLLHSFPLPHDYSASVNKHFQVTGMSSGIPGTISWRDEGGEAIVHPIQMGSAALRRFSITAALKPRDSSVISSKQILLPRGGIFEVTLIFLKDFTSK